jgi:hypothetical protein
MRAKLLPTDPDEIARWLKESLACSQNDPPVVLGLPPTGEVIADGWRFLYSEPTDTVPFYGFSAMLWPEGRGFTEADWYTLGQVSAAIGVPTQSPERLVFNTDVATVDPNSVLKWLWK